MPTRLHAVLLSIISTLLLAPISAVRASDISGVHEVVFGVTDLEGATKYWNRFGYRVVDRGSLSEAEAMALYNVPSAARAVRMQHLESDHNAVRLWEWERETGPGAGIVPLMTPGARWVSSYLKNQVELYYQAIAHQQAGEPIHIVHPQVHSTGFRSDELHMGDFNGYAEIVILTPDYRRVFAQRWGEERPNFGSTENEDSHYKSTQLTHVGFAIQAEDVSVLDFYPDVLGLQPRGPEGFKQPEELQPSWIAIYGVPPGKGYGSTNYGNPTDTATEVRLRKSGSLLIRRVLPDPTRPPVEARPGAHGLTLFTYAVKNIDRMRSKVAASDATRVTPVLKNEFGEKSFSFISPDGMDWSLVEWK